jgi:hypothetical protein
MTMADVSTHIRAQPLRVELWAGPKPHVVKGPGMLELGTTASNGGLWKAMGGRSWSDTANYVFGICPEF